MSTTKSLMTNMCGSGAIFDLVPGSRSTFVRHAREFDPLMFIAQDPQIPSLLQKSIQRRKHPYSRYIAMRQVML